MTTADRPPVSGEPHVVEPVDSVAAALDTTMPALIDLDPDWQSRWSTAALFIEELRKRGFTIEASTGAALDFDSANALLSAYNYWVNEHPDATVGDRYDWTKRYLARLAEQEESA